MNSRMPQSNGRAHEDPERLLAGGGNPFATEALQLREILGILRRRFVAVLLVMLVIVSGAAAWLWARAPLYDATAAVLMVDTRRSLAGPILGEGTVRGVGRLTDPIRSTVEVIRGRAVLGKAVDREGLRLLASGGVSPPRFISDVAVAESAAVDLIELRFAPRRVAVRTRVGQVVAAYGQGIHIAGVAFTVNAAPPVEATTLRVIPREAAIDLLADRLRVMPRPGTDVIEIGYTSTDSIGAQRVVNTIAEEFQRYNQQMVQQQTRLRRVFLERQLRSTESELTVANQALNGFRQSRQVYRPAEQLTAGQQALMSLEIQRSQLQADRGMYGSLLGALRSPAPEERSQAIRTLVASPGIAANPVMTQLYDQLAAQEARRDELTAGPLGSTAADPDVQRLNRLVAVTEQKLIDASRSHLASIDARLAALDSLRARKLAEIQALPAAEAEEARLTENIRTIGSLADALRADLDRARMAEAIETGQVEILNFAPPAEPVRGDRRKRLLLAGILGLVFGAGAAFGLEFLDGTIRRRGEVEGMGLPCLAMIPRLTKNGRVPARLRLPGVARRGNGKPGGAPLTIVTTDPAGGVGVEAFRRLRNTLFLPTVMGIGNTLMITSPSPGEGKTVTSANLAIVLARQGKRVLVIDADLNRPSLHKAFRQALQPGICEVLLGEVTSGAAIRQTGIENLYLLSAGECPPAGDDPFQGDALRVLLSGLAGEFDSVILDTPPVLDAAAVMTFATASDGVLLVLRAGTTRPDVARQAVEELTRVGAHIVGAVIADPDRKLLDQSGVYGYSSGRSV